jgi:hypothetical protein
MLDYCGRDTYLVTNPRSSGWIYQWATPMTIYTIDYRPVQLPGGPECRWMVATNLQPETREEAERKVAACRRAMPMREYRIREMQYDDEGPTDDIPF